MKEDVAQLEEYLRSLQPSQNEFECLRDPKLLWPQSVRSTLPIIRNALGPDVLQGTMALVS